MFTLYHFPASGNSYKARLALSMFHPESELAIAYVDILAGESRTPEFLKLNPVGQIPVLVIDGPDGAEVIPESHAILWRLGSGTSFLPADAKIQTQIVRWMTFEQCKLDPKLGTARFWVHAMGRAPENCPVDIADLTAQARNALAIVDDHLRSNDFMAGAEPTIADIAIFGYAPLAPDIGIDLSDCPSLEAWIKRFEGLPGFIPIADEIANFENRNR